MKHPNGWAAAPDITSKLHRHTKACWQEEPVIKNSHRMRRCAVLAKQGLPDWALFDYPEPAS